jgi:hypothetical protein
VATKGCNAPQPAADAPMPAIGERIGNGASELEPERGFIRYRSTPMLTV